MNAGSRASSIALAAIFRNRLARLWSGFIVSSLLNGATIIVDRLDTNLSSPQAYDQKDHERAELRRPHGHASRRRFDSPGEDEATISLAVNRLPDPSAARSFFRHRWPRSDNAPGALPQEPSAPECSEERGHDERRRLGDRRRQREQGRAAGLVRERPEAERNGISRKV